jgi:hypothetical protein
MVCSNGTGFYKSGGIRHPHRKIWLVVMEAEGFGLAERKMMGIRDITWSIDLTWWNRRYTDDT